MMAPVKVRIEAHSTIDADGCEYFLGPCEEYVLDRYELQNGRGWCVEIYHRQQYTDVFEFRWLHGVPCVLKRIKRYTGEVIDKQELARVLSECGVDFLEVRT